MIVTSIDHHRATPEQLARLSANWEDLAGIVMKCPSISGVVVLATCARLEVYVDATQYHPATDAVTEALTITADTSVAEIAGVAQVQRGSAALEHLFAVASGMRSMVMGEDQVVGQVSEALSRAQRDSTTTRSLTMAFQNAIRVSRLVRSRDGADRSIIGALLDSLGDKQHTDALVIGTGAYARVAVSALSDRGYRSIGVLSPSGRTETIPGTSAVSIRDLADRMTVADVVIGCSGRGNPVVTEGLAVDVLARRSRPLIAIDVALQPDIERALDRHPGIRVLRMADVPASAGSPSIEDAMHLISRETRALTPRIIDGELDELITTMRGHVQRLAEQEVRRVDNPEHAAAVEQALHRFTQALLHTPTARARESAATERLDGFRHAVGWVFDLEGSPR